MLNHRDSLRKLCFLTLQWGLIMLAAMPSSTAAALDKAACAKLAEEMQNMKALDIDKLMEKGPNWAISHLSPSDITLIRQYIDLDEQMKFRCSAPSSLVHLKHLEEDDEDGNKPQAEASDENGKKQQSAGSTGDDANAQKKKPVKPAPKPQAAAATNR